MMAMNEIENIKITDDTYADLARILDMMPPSMLRKNQL